MSLRSRLVNPTGSLVRRLVPRTSSYQSARYLASIAHPPPVNPHSRNQKVVIVGGGSAGLTISNQLLRSGNFSSEDIALVDPAEWHHYQPGWTLVGGGLKNKHDLKKKKLGDMVDRKVHFYNSKVQGFSPDQNSVLLHGGERIV